MNYDFEYQYRKYNHKQRKYRIPIKKNIDNQRYKQEQIALVRSMFPNGANKQIDERCREDLLLDLLQNKLNNQIEVII